MLAAVVRRQVPGTGRGHKGEKSVSAALTGFRVLIGKFKLDPDTAMKAQRIGRKPSGYSDGFDLGLPHPVDRLIARQHGMGGSQERFSSWLRNPQVPHC